MKKFLMLIVILCLAFLLYASAQENDATVDEVTKLVPKEVATRLDVTILDGINDRLFKLENCAVFVKGKLKIANDLFDYTKTFTEGDRYEITISIRKKI